nr:hypothetical protein [Tanacetum cinerariifolium]
MTLLNTLLETCAILTKKVANLEQDKVSQAIKITKSKQMVRRLEKKRQFKSSGLKRLRKRRLEESQAKAYHLDLAHAEKVLKVVTTATTITVVQVPLASAPRKRRGVVMHDPKETTTPSVIVHSEVKSKDKVKGILIEEPKPLKRQAQIEQDEAFVRQLEAELNANINWSDVMDQVKRKEKQDNTVMRYQAVKRKPITEAHARKNMMIYLKNMAGFKMDFFKGMTYTIIRPIFEKHYSSIQTFLDKGEEEITKQEEGSKRKDASPEQRAAKKQRINEEEEELKRYLQIVVNDDDDVFTKATPLALKVPVVDYQIYYENNKPFYKIIRADGTHMFFLSFITILKNFDREDLEMLWKLVQERFQSSEPKNFSHDFLLNTFKTMFQKPNVEASIWREKYPLTRFTLEQMLNNVRLEVKKESEMSLELLSFFGKKVAYPVVANYVRNTWGKYGLTGSMFSSSTELFSFQFSSMDGLDAMLENGPWFIQNNPLNLKKWHPNENLLKEDVSIVSVWVKVHSVHVTAFSDDGLSAIATKLGTPLMLDSYTSDMCMQSWGRSSYARIMVELRADVKLNDNIVVVIPKITREGHYTCNVRVEYE